MTVDASSRKSIRLAEKSARQAAASRAEVTRSIMSTTQGREWMWNTLASCHIFDNTFYPDPHQSAFAQGERNAGLRLLADIMLNCPDQFIQAQREANERRNLDDTRSASADDERRSGAIDDGRDSGSGDDNRSQAAADGNGYYFNDDGDEAGDEAFH